MINDHLLGLTPFEQQMYDFYCRKAQEANKPEDAEMYVKAVQRLAEKSEGKSS